jgi:hypothetical protein
MTFRSDTFSVQEHRDSAIQQAVLNQNITAAKLFVRQNPSYFGYKTFRQVMGSSNEVLSKLRGIPDLSPFFSLKNSVLSLIQPKLKFFRVSYDKIVVSADGRDTGKREALLYPCYQEIRFADGFGQVSTVEEYLSRESTTPDFHNVGLQSFELNHDGGHDGARSFNQTANVNLIFKSMKDLQARVPGPAGDGEHGMKYVDMILWPGSRALVGAGHNVNPKHYEIKVLVGYHAPSSEVITNMKSEIGSESTEKLLRVLERIRIVYSLRMQKYNFDIKADGHVLLKISYQSAVESVFDSNHLNIYQESYKIDDKGATTFKPADEGRGTAQLAALHGLIRQSWEALQLKKTCGRNPVERKV